MLTNLFYLSALVCASRISAESSESSDETYAVRAPMYRPVLRVTRPIVAQPIMAQPIVAQPIIAQPIVNQPRLSCRMCVRQCLYDDDDDSNIFKNVVDDSVNVADAANEKFNWSSRGFCRQCINRCSRQMCARMGFLPMIKRHSGADSHHRQLMEELNEAKSNEAKTEWGWGRGWGGYGGWGRGYGGWGRGFGGWGRWW